MINIANTYHYNYDRKNKIQGWSYIVAKSWRNMSYGRSIGPRVPNWPYELVVFFQGFPLYLLDRRKYCFCNFGHAKQARDSSGDETRQVCKLCKFVCNFP